jgi:bifunctional UDP-N-acetylglucosamine pyrophosphorylase/glucosamine-1-phosphate N-acetyltransferase
MRCKAIVLAAGKGKRLRSGEDDFVPKVMKLADGYPLIAYVIRELDFIPPGDRVAVVGFGKEYVIEYLKGRCVFVEQKEQLGTGHAVGSCREELEGYDGPVLVCMGDMPLVTSGTYMMLLKRHIEDANDCTILSSEAGDPGGYGRIKRTPEGMFSAIVEEKDCTDEERSITEINSGVYVFDARNLFSALEEVTADNAQREYYLTDVPGIMKRKGRKVGICKTKEEWQFLGINTVEQLMAAEKIIREKGLRFRTNGSDNGEL